VNAKIHPQIPWSESSGVEGGDQPRVGQRAVQEAMWKVQEGHAQTRTQSILPQHQVRFDGRTPITFETMGMVNTGAIASTLSVVAASDEKQSSNNTDLIQRNVVYSTPRTAAGNVAEDDDAEYEVEERNLWLSYSPESS
jgi:hypothetical protein